MAPSSGRIEQDMWASFAVLVILIQIVKGASSFTMLSRGQLYVMNAGESIELDCEFYTKYFNLFDNPVLWIKTQYNEASRINIMGNINEPFVGTGRFKVRFLPSPPRFRLVLSIEGLSLEDSGNYTCEVRGPNTSVLAVITHRLFIRAPVQDVILNRDNCTENCDPYTPSHLSFTENEQSLLQCIATGGNPPPDLKVFIGDFDITYRFKTDTYTRLLGSHGLRIMHSSVHTRTENLVLTSADDGKILKCTAAVPGLPANVTRTKIRVNYAPVITCEPNAALDNEKNVYVSCQVRSSPRATTLFWVIDANGTTLSEGQIVDEYWTLVQDRSDGVMETKLFMRRTVPASFKKYTLVAENSVGIQREDVELVRKHPTGERMENDPPYYGRRDYDQSPGGPHVDYIFIPAGAGQQRHLATDAMNFLVAFHVLCVFINKLC